MSSTAGTRQVPHPSSGQAQPGPSAGQEQGPALGLASATALVMGSIIGVGVFTMPAVLAAAGTSSLVVMGVVAVGAMLLAVLFGQLTRRVPKADGGLYAYARHEFGDFAGYLTGWSYWITSWAGNAAIATSWFWLPGTSLLPSVVTTLVMKVVDLVLAFVLWKVLHREVTRYRATSPDLPPSLRL